MLRLPLVPPCPVVPGSSGGVLAIFPRGLSITLTPLQHRSAFQHRQALFAHRLGTALKSPQSHRHLPGQRPLGDLPDSPALPVLAGVKEGDEGGHTPQGALPDKAQPCTLHRHFGGVCRARWEWAVMGEVPELPWEQPRVGIFRVSQQGQPKVSLYSLHCLIPPMRVQFVGVPHSLCRAKAAGLLINT